MKAVRTILCIIMVCFILFSPSFLVRESQKSFVDARFIRKTGGYKGSIVLYHIVRHRPYSGSLTQWLNNRAEEYEKTHKGVYFAVEGMDEEHFYERVEHGRKPDAYSFFSGSIYPDLLKEIPDLQFSFRQGLFQTDRCIPYAYSGYCRLIREPDAAGEKVYCPDDLLAARMNIGYSSAAEDHADILYLDLRRAGDLIRYHNGFSLSEIEPIDHFTDAVCWMGIDRSASDEKTQVLMDFMDYLLSPESQQKLNAIGMLSAVSSVKNTPSSSMLKSVFKTYESVQTVDPFLWQREYDILCKDAKLARTGDAEACLRFRNRLSECFR